MAFSLSSFKSFSALQGWACSSTEQVFAGYPRPSSLVLPSHSLSTSVVAFSRRRNNKSAIPKKNKRNASVEVTREEVEEEEDMDDDAFEALFNMLEEDLKNNGSPIDDNDDDDISEEDFEKLQRALEEALGIGDDDDDDDDESGELLNSAGNFIDIEEHVDEEEDEDEEEKPVQLKNWQLRRLARALKTGRRKTNIKSLAAELCLDRAIVLELLRDPPPNLVMMSAALRDEPAPTPTLLPSEKAEPIDVVPVEVETVDDSVKSESEKKVPVHVMRQRWSAQKRLKKVHIETLERVYRKTKRPTNAMVSSIVQVTNLPRKRIVQWFEDKRNEDGVPEERAPYQRTNSFASQTE